MRQGKAHRLLMEKEYKRAAELLESTIAIDPSHYCVLLLQRDLGVCLYHLGDYEQSLGLMKKVLDDIVLNPGLWINRFDKNPLEYVQWYINANEEALRRKQQI